MIYNIPSTVQTKPPIIIERSIDPRQNNSNCPLIPLANAKIPNLGGNLVFGTAAGSVTTASGASLHYTQPSYYVTIVPPYILRAEYEMRVQNFASISEQVIYPKELNMKTDPTT